MWSSEEGPPSHSVPAHAVSKAARRIDEKSASVLHDSLLEAYFKEHRDITSVSVLLDLWISSGLPEGRFEETQDEALAHEILADHHEALENGASGVPAIRAASHFGVLMGAQPLEVMLKWVDRLAAAG